MQTRRAARPKRRAVNYKLTKPQTIRLSISAGIFLALVLIRVFDPSGSKSLSTAVDAYIGDSTPATIQALGDAIISGGSLVEVFHSVSDVLTGNTEKNEPDGTPAPDVSPAPTGTAAPSPSAAPLFSAEDIYDEPYFDPEIIGEGDLLSGGGFGVDDTLPLPFGYDAPPNVDFSVHTFNFEYTMPIAGEITSGFGFRIHPVRNEMLFHYGTDIAAKKGEEIQCFADGVVSGAGYSDTYGNYLLISHADGVSSFYAHCTKTLVKQGKSVKRGQVIALAGNTGVVTGPHLHFELRMDGKLLNPDYFIGTYESY